MRSTVIDRTWLVRYRFDNPAQLRAHLQMSEDGRGLLCLGPSRGRLSGSRAVVQARFTGTDDEATLHGTVRLRERVDRGTPAGAWLEVHDAAALSRWMRLEPVTRRRCRRVAADLLAEVRPRGALPYLCRVLDVSRRGVRLGAGVQGALVPQDEVEVTLLGPEPGVAAVEAVARVAWVGQRGAGIQLPEQAASGTALAELVRFLEARWSGADELIHPESCTCAHGGARLLPARPAPREAYGEAAALASGQRHP